MRDAQANSNHMSSFPFPFPVSLERALSSTKPNLSKNLIMATPKYVRMKDKKEGGNNPEEGSVTISTESGASVARMSMDLPGN